MSSPGFEFDLRDDLADDDAPVGVSEGEVVVLIDPEAMTGIALSPEAALRFAATITRLARGLLNPRRPLSIAPRAASSPPVHDHGRGENRADDGFRHFDAEPLPE